MTNQPSFGIAGHGLLLAPMCPCRIGHSDNGMLLVAPLVSIDDNRGAFVASAAIIPGQAPATGSPEQLTDSSPSGMLSWKYGEAGPEISVFANAKQPTDVFTRIDAGLGEAPWQLLAPGFWVGFPPGFTLMSSMDADDPYFELHLNRDDQPVPDAFIKFERRPIAAADLRLAGDTNVDESVLETAEGAIRTLEFGYDHEGTHWIRRIYALPLAPDVTIVMSAGAPASEFERMFDGADAVAAGFAPLD